MTQESTDAASLGSIETEQIVVKSLQANMTEIIEGGAQMMQISSLSSTAFFNRHIMCKDFKVVPSFPPRYNPVEPTTIFRPSDIRAVCLTTVSVDSKMEFRWYYRSNSSKTWVSCFNWTQNFLNPGEYDYGGFLYIAGYWPGLNYPRGYKVEVYLDGSFSFSEFFEVTNGGLNSPRMCGGIDLNGNPVFVKSRFTKGLDMTAYHYLRFDKIAYFNEEQRHCHNFTTVWIQPNGSMYKMYSGYLTDYKDTDVTWNYWQYNYTSDDYISINPGTPVGNWKVEVYLDRYFNNTWMRYGPVATTPFIVGSAQVADWTFMVYLDADNNLENAGIDIFLKMAEVGSNSKVNIIVQMDRIPGQNSSYGDWTDCKRFNITKGMTPTPKNAVMNLSEVNMGDPSTLKDFVNWTINNYPANYYFLVLWNHGTGCMGICFDVTNNTDFLTLPELSQALSGLPAIMDVVFLDACSMSMTEVAYQVKDYANVLVGPEGLGYAPPPYDDYLRKLINYPSMLPSAFATEVVKDYMKWCRSEPQIQNATMSATDITKITSLIVAIDDFAIKLKEKEILYHDLISLARNRTEGYPGPYAGQSGYYIDLYHFGQLTYQNVNDEELQNTADQVKTTLENIIIFEDDKACPNSHGLSIFFPNEKAKYDSFETEYEETTFAKDTPWDEFVKNYLNIQTSGCILTIQTPYPSITVEFEEEPYKTDVEGKLRLFVLPNSYKVSVPTQVDKIFGPGSRGIFTQWNDLQTNPSRTITVTGSATYTAYYKTQYEVTFGLSCVGVDFTGIVVTIDENGYNVTFLPVSFWWDNATLHTFAFQSPLIVASDVKRYVWNSTSGLSHLQSDSISLSASGNINGNYKTQYRVTFTQSGVGTDFTGTVVTVDKTEYSVGGLPVSFWWEFNSSHTFAFQSPLAVAANAKQYVWNSTTGLSSMQSSSINVSMRESIIGNYRTEYFLKISTNLGTINPNSGWHDAGSTVQISAIALDAGDGERYVWLGWTGTGNGCSNSADNPTTITMKGPINQTAAWRHEYYLTLTSAYGSPTLTSGWLEAGKSINVSVESPLPGLPGIRYICTGWTGTGSVSTSGTTTTVTFTLQNLSGITWNWKTQYLLTIRIDPAELNLQANVSPPGPWYDNGTIVNCTAQTISEYVFDYWSIDRTNWDRAVNSILITMDGPHEAIIHYVHALAWWETLFRDQMLYVVLGLVGMALTVTLVSTAWVRTRRRGIMKGPKPVAIGVSEVVPDHITTGYADLDNLLFGGIPKNYAVILTSPSCDERDLLIRKFLETGARKGEVTFHLTIDPAEAKILAEEFQSNFYLFICNPQADTIIESLPNVFKLKGVENLTDISIALTSAFRILDESPKGPRRACIEIISDILLQHHAVQTRRWLTDIITELRSRAFTTLAVMNPKMHPLEEVHAIIDLFGGEINIYERAREEKFLKIKKMHNRKYLESELPLKKERLEK